MALSCNNKCINGTCNLPLFSSQNLTLLADLGIVSVSSIYHAQIILSLTHFLKVVSSARHAEIRDFWSYLTVGVCVSGPKVASICCHVHENTVQCCVIRAVFPLVVGSCRRPLEQRCSSAPGASYQFRASVVVQGRASVPAAGGNDRTCGCQARYTTCNRGKTATPSNGSTEMMAWDSLRQLETGHGGHSCADS